jgi:2-dehydro-3-deoxyphosphogluconate aldolase / (4S)-4-hydroxy-2-oxoglutarate aldolase
LLWCKGLFDPLVCLAILVEIVPPPLHPSTEPTWLTALRQDRAIAILRAASLAEGQAMADAAVAGGLRWLEVTLTSAEPLTLVRSLRQRYANCWVGVGTVRSAAELDQAIAAGAQYAFSPFFDASILQAAQAARLPWIPGALTPTEIVTAWSAGASAIKVFPVESLGGPRYIANLQGPLPEVLTIPTGGVTIDNAAAFIEAGALAVGLGSSLFLKADVAAGNWGAIVGYGRLLSDRLASCGSHRRQCG